MEGNKQNWLVTNEDLDSMYSKYCTGEITLVRWRKQDSEASVSRRKEREEEVDTVFEYLEEKHGNKFDTPKL